MERAKAISLLLFWSLAALSLVCADEESNPMLKKKPGHLSLEQIKRRDQMGQEVRAAIGAASLDECGKRGFFKVSGALEPEHHDTDPNKRRANMKKAHRRADKAAKRIKNGTRIRGAEFPSWGYLLADESANGAEVPLFCNVVVVGPQVILGAASCLQGYDLYLSKTKVLLAHFVQDGKVITFDAHIERILGLPGLCKITDPQDSKNVIYQNDLVIIQTKDRVVSSELMHYACIAWDDLLANLRRDDEYYDAVGLGHDDDGIRYQITRAKKTRISTSWCHPDDNGVKQLVDKSDTLRCYGTWDSDFCMRYAGDPVYYYRYDIHGNELVYLAGLVSSPASHKCTPGKTNVYVTDIVQMLPALHKAFVETKDGYKRLDQSEIVIPECKKD